MDTASGPAAGDGLTGPATASVLAYRLRSGRDGTRFFCGMGVCMECEGDVDGRITRLCLEPSLP